MGNNLSNFPRVYLDMMHDLMSVVASNNAQTTIEGIKNLYFQRKSVASVSDENQRNNVIFKHCHLETEPGFCTGSTKEERMKELNEKICLLMDAYSDAKKNDYLEHFFLSAFESDSCFNHRLDHLAKFYEQHKGKKVTRTA